MRGSVRGLSLRWPWHRWTVSSRRRPCRGSRATGRARGSGASTASRCGATRPSSSLVTPVKRSREHLRARRDAAIRCFCPFSCSSLLFFGHQVHLSVLLFLFCFLAIRCVCPFSCCSLLFPAIRCVSSSVFLCFPFGFLAIRCTWSSTVSIHFCLFVLFRFPSCCWAWPSDRASPRAIAGGFWAFVAMLARPQPEPPCLAISAAPPASPPPNLATSMPASPTHRPPPCRPATRTPTRPASSNDDAFRSRRARTSSAACNDDPFLHPVLTPSDVGSHGPPERPRHQARPRPRSALRPLLPSLPTPSRTRPRTTLAGSPPRLLTVQVGAELPAYVHDRSLDTFQQCLVSDISLATCDAAYAKTSRLCRCVPARHDR
mmetsp:Transcript_34565/g.109990  ORF Transcript_34565/g.109990 Transcript_34565/m.109990 type:complete len:374 (-) Transcript_34565:173-1294(-)